MVKDAAIILTDSLTTRLRWDGIALREWGLDQIMLESGPFYARKRSLYARTDTRSDTLGRMICNSKSNGRGTLKIGSRKEQFIVRRRQRQPDNLANPAAVRAVLIELKELCPSLSDLSDRKLNKLLMSVRHIETYPATDTNRGRPLRYDRELLNDVRRRLKAILEHEAGDRVSIQTFIGHYLPILAWPPDVANALVRGELSRLEAAQVARLTADRLRVKPREAAKIREEITSNHIRS